MVNRARSWALWKALIIYDDVNPVFRENVRYTIHNILNKMGLFQIVSDIPELRNAG